MCDAWLARIVTGDDSRMSGGRRAGDPGMGDPPVSVPAAQFCPRVSDGLFVLLESPRQRTWVRPGGGVGSRGPLPKADTLLEDGCPSDPLTPTCTPTPRASCISTPTVAGCVAPVCHADKRWRKPVYGAAATAMATYRLASLGVFEDAFRRARTPWMPDWCGGCRCGALHPGDVLAASGKAEEANQLPRRVYSAIAEVHPGPRSLDDPAADWC